MLKLQSHQRHTENMAETIIHRTDMQWQAFPKGGDIWLHADFRTKEQMSFMFRVYEILCEAQTKKQTRN